MSVIMMLFAIILLGKLSPVCNYQAQTGRSKGDLMAMRMHSQADGAPLMQSSTEQSDLN